MSSAKDIMLNSVDVEGLVLTIGEPSTGRAIDALEAQTHRLSGISLVENVTPFHRAINQGVGRVAAPFFLQCDADMVPDPDCVEVLLAHMGERTGVAVGYLQDPLWGKIQAIKLFRTECVRRFGFPDHVSPDTELISHMMDRGFECVFATRPSPRFGRDRDTFGLHDPEYDPLYTFQKFRLEGARMFARGRFGELQATVERLSNSSHPMATVAIVALCRGLFEDRNGDGLAPYQKDETFLRLERYLSGSDKTQGRFDPVA